MQGLYKNALINLALADILTNIHGFIAVVTNHAGDDMYRFRDGCRPFSGSFYLRQVLASVDFSMGTDLVDFSHGFLNYQIEHHLWPSLSMLSYQKSAPLVREICEKHGVPYIKENVFIRLKKTIDIMVGNTSMKWFPEKYERMFLDQDALAEAQKNKRS
jgi:fatty acid desaturase